MKNSESAHFNKTNPNTKSGYKVDTKLLIVLEYFTKFMISIENAFRLKYLNPDLLFEVTSRSRIEENSEFLAFDVTNDTI